MDPNLLKALKNRMLENKNKLLEIKSKLSEGTLTYDPSSEVLASIKETENVMDFLKNYAKGNVNVHGKKCTPKKCVCGIGFN